MSCLPELDTQGALKRYAKNPTDNGALLGYIMLRKRAASKAVWEAATNIKTKDLQKAYDIYLGVMRRRSTKTTIKAADLAEMPAKERDDLYLRLCESVGIKVDPHTLLNARKKKH